MDQRRAPAGTTGAAAVTRVRAARQSAVARRWRHERVIIDGVCEAGVIAREGPHVGDGRSAAMSM